MGVVTVLDEATGAVTDVTSPLCVGGGGGGATVPVKDARAVEFLREYLEKREADAYVDALEECLEPSAKPVSKPLLERPIDAVLCEWDRAFVARVMARGGIHLLLALVAVAEGARCVWLLDVLTVHLAHLVRTLSPDAVRGLFRLAPDDTTAAPTDQMPEFSWVQSMVYSPER
eukprot:TRINITY_DN26339_c0_g1_i1.p1 TRINITY_DN26339_c0_g1~~TRINITY_DN26339_c0_g1_i1.p1  ORF type:complete len:173 (+),score=50.24 TRINITY_DN26339_c0_g1_i1:75-593(+)